MLNDLEEIENAERILARLRTPGKIEILSLVNNKVTKFGLDSKYANRPIVVELLEEFSKFIEVAIFIEMEKLGDDIQATYTGHHFIDDAKTVEETRTAFYNSRPPQLDTAETGSVDA